MRDVVSKGDLARNFGVTEATLTEWEEKIAFPLPEWDQQSSQEVYDIAAISAWTDVAHTLMAREETAELLNRLQAGTGGQASS
ncbi:MAG: hypothetical protein JWO70_2470 [Betaproteobacteria bacterium]|nr:hypothetical protein [Betaproteobacteria bacterium]